MGNRKLDEVEKDYQLDNDGVSVGEDGLSYISGDNDDNDLSRYSVARSKSIKSKGYSAVSIANAERAKSKKKRGEKAVGKKARYVA